MIDRISIENFMRLEDCQNIPLGPLTLLVGQNGSGKSSVLKAIHWASRCASLAQSGKLPVELMDFAPSIDFRSLAHKSTLQGKNRGGGTTKPVIVTFKRGVGEGAIKLKSLGNDAGVSVEVEHHVAPDFVREEPQTAYIPGLAGLAEHETILAAPVFRRKAASGDGGSVLRQMLLNTHSEEMNTGEDAVELAELSELVAQVIPGVRFWVKFDQRRDAFIRAWFYTPDMRYGDTGSNYKTMRRPLEMAGTGLLQVTQIFAYLLTFRPRLLLIDEPDAHLHQSSQEKLVLALEAALRRFAETQIIVSTHSPRIVRVSGQSTKVVWLDGGSIKDEGHAVRERMGWGALDKDIVIFSEDDNTDHLQSIIDQWPHLAHRTVIWPCFGVSSIPDGDRLSKLRDRHGIKVMVHRDRDFMTDMDIDAWKNIRRYTVNDIPVWLSVGSDIESCFHSANHIADAMGIHQAVAEKSLEYALAELNEVEIRASFNEAYGKAVQSLPGQADAIGRWIDLGGFCKNTVKGKEFAKALRRGLQRALPEVGQARKLEGMGRIYEGNSNHPLCDDLRLNLQALADEQG
ncbi:MULTISPECIES: AAA family ATPase [Roseobacteraceae]|uniref:AAA family ATPase n=1 Tax=Roseobacteraceae TaxID=2854170 RepID=UPI0031DA1BCF